MCYISFLLIVLKSYVAALSCCYFCKTFVAFGFACFTLHCGLWLLFVEERFRSAFVDVRPCRHNGTVTAHTIHSPPCFSHSLRLVLMFLVPSSTEFKLFPFSVIVCLVYQVMYFEVVLMFFAAVRRVTARVPRLFNSWKTATSSCSWFLATTAPSI